MSWLIEAYLNEAEVATEKRPSIRTNGTHNYDGEEIYYKRNRNGELEQTERPARDTVKTGIGIENHHPVVYKNHTTIDNNGNETTHDNSEDKEKYKQAKKYANKQLKSGLLKKADREQVAQAADAITRYDRRHSDRKIIKDCADIVELMQ